MLRNTKQNTFNKQKQSYQREIIRFFYFNVQIRV